MLYLFFIFLTSCAIYQPTREQCIRYAQVNGGYVHQECEHYYEPRKNP